MKNITKIVLICIVIAIVFIIGYFILQKKEYNKEENEFLYEKAIAYFEEKNINKYYYENKQNYKLFTEYEKFGTEEKGNKKYVYMWILEHSYYVENGIVTSASGGSSPCKFTFKNDEVINYEEPIDGEGNVKSMKSMFPKFMHSKVLKYDSSNIRIKLNEKVYKYYENLGVEENIKFITGNEFYDITDLKQ